MLTVNTLAPEFEAVDQAGQKRKLSDCLGKWVVLYFYPKDDTPGCTKEACNFRDNHEAWNKTGVIVIGVSKDSGESHKKFADKYNLNFPILADPEKKIIEAYGAWGKKKFLGKEYMGVSRISYLIDPKGIIKKVYPKVNPLTHAGEIIEDLNSFKK